MGKGILLFLAATAIGGTLMYNSGTLSSRDRGESIANYEYDVLARQIALSAMNIGIVEAKNNFAVASNILQSQIPFRDGVYNLTGSTLASGLVGLHSVGFIGDTEYHICSNMADGGGGPIESALIIETEDANVDFKGNSFLISGMDTQPPSLGGVPPFNGGPSAGTNRPVHAIGVPSSSVETTFESEPSSVQEDNITGMDGNLDVYSGPTAFDVDAFYQETINLADTVMAGGMFNGNPIYGSKDAPAVVRITGDAVINGDFEGYGVLLIEGDMVLGSGSFLWEGIVMVYSPTGADLNVTLSGNVDIYGALIIKVADSPNPEELTFELDLEQKGNAAISYSADAIDRLAAEFTTIAQTSPMKVHVTSRRESKAGC